MDREWRESPRGGKYRVGSVILKQYFLNVSEAFCNIFLTFLAIR